MYGKQVREPLQEPRNRCVATKCGSPLPDRSNERDSERLLRGETIAGDEFMAN